MQKKKFDKKDITCPVCLCEFKEPCFVCSNHHTLCRSCYLQTNRHRTCCPTCRQEMTTPRENAAMRSLICMYHQLPSPANRISHRTTESVAKPVEDQGLLELHFADKQTGDRDLQMIQVKSRRVVHELNDSKKRFVKAHEIINREVDRVIEAVERRRKVAHETLSLAEPPLKRLRGEAKALDDAIAAGDKLAASDSLARLSDSLELNKRQTLFKEIKVPKLLTIQDKMAESPKSNRNSVAG